jgi:hypothetical protein
MRAVLVAASAVVGVAAGHLPEEDRMATGYNDGFAVGYAAACRAETIVIDGQWSNASYSEGYAAGVADGALACAEEQD